MSAEDDRPKPTEPQDWFRSPTPREHRIAGWLFIGFGLFFVAYFFVLAGWPFRWVICGLGVYSFLYGVRHLKDARRSGGP